MVQSIKTILATYTNGDIKSRINPQKATEGIINALNLCNIRSEEQINGFLREIAEQYKNHPAFNGRSCDLHIDKYGEKPVIRRGKEHNNDVATTEQLHIIASELVKRLDRNMIFAISGEKITKNVSQKSLSEKVDKLLSRYENEYNVAFEKAYGGKDARKVAEAYAQNQAQKVQNIQRACDFISTITMLVPGGIAMGGGWLVKLAEGTKYAQIASKAAPAIEGAEILSKIGSGFLMFNTFNPVILKEIFSSNSKMTEEKAREWSSEFLSKITFMGLGMGAASIAKSAASVIKAHALVKALKMSGKNIDEIAETIKTYPSRLDPAVFKGFQWASATATASQIGLESILNIATIYTASKIMGGDGANAYDCFIAIGFALLGSKSVRNRMKKSDEYVVNYLCKEFKEIELSKADAQKIVKTMRDIEAGRIKKSYLTKEELQKEELTETTEMREIEVKTEAKPNVIKLPKRKGIEPQPKKGKPNSITTEDTIQEGRLLQIERQYDENGLLSSSTTYKKNLINKDKRVMTEKRKYTYNEDGKIASVVVDNISKNKTTIIEYVYDEEGVMSQKNHYSTSGQLICIEYEGDFVEVMVSAKNNRNGYLLINANTQMILAKRVRDNRGTLIQEEPYTDAGLYEFISHDELMAIRKLQSQNYGHSVATVMVKSPKANALGKNLVDKFIKTLRTKANIKDKYIAQYLEENTIVDIQKFIQYIESIDMDKLYNMAPYLKKVEPQNLLAFFDYHFINNRTTEFTPEMLKFPEDLTTHLAKNFLTRTQINKLMAIYPLTTKRNIGELPPGWNDSGNPRVTKGVKTTIDAMNKLSKNERTPEMIELFSQLLSRDIGKKVTITELKPGEFGTGYKIEVEGAKPVVLKIYHRDNKYPGEIEKHGVYAEPQRGPFLNQNSDKFAHFYFGKIATDVYDDGYMVTEFLSDNKSSSKTINNTSNLSNNSKYIITCNDINTEGNIIGNKISDFGAVEVQKK